MYSRLIRAREIHLSQRDKNRYVRPFDWGTGFVQLDDGIMDPRSLFRRHTRRVMADSDSFFELPPIRDFDLSSNILTWTSAIQTPEPVNNTVTAHFFDATPGKKSSARRAMIVLPQWNAQPESHVELCRILQRFGISSLRLTLPYHGSRKPADLERADFLVCSNVGRTIQSMRQAVLDTRAAVRWLVQRGFERIGIVGTSIGSCTAFLAFAHEPALSMGVFNHVSGYFADVVWNGKPRPVRFIAAKHDLTFPVDLSRNVIAEVRNMGIPIDVCWLPCGHYTSGEKPWIFLDGWKITSFIRKHL